MKQAFIDLDRILRGDATHLDALGEGALPTPARRLSVVLLILAMFYGLCMGSFAIVNGQSHGWLQMLSSTAKVPALFFLTLAVTLPSLYVFNALVGSRLKALSFMRLLVAAMGVTLALLASFGTIVAFFSFTTASHSFIVLLNVVVFAVSGVLGLTFLLRTLQRLTIAGDDAAVATALTREPVTPLTISSKETSLPPSDPQEVSDVATQSVHAVPGALSKLQVMTRDVKFIFYLWIVLFGLVGAQMSWILRPFIGSGPEFMLFKPRGSNFFESVFHHVCHLLGF